MVIATLTVWTFAGALSIVPAILSGQNPNFYDNSHVCIGIPLALVTTYSTHSSEKTLWFNMYYSIDKTFTTTQLVGSKPGMYFSTAVFIGVNSLCYVIILGCYAELLRVVYKTSKQKGLDREMKAQLGLTARVTAIVATDFLCWCPIIVLGILVQTEVLTLPVSVFAWMVALVLPLNSAINPYLYTIADVIDRRRHGNKQVDGSLNSDEETRRSEARGREPNEGNDVEFLTDGKQTLPSAIINVGILSEQEGVELHNVPL